VGKIFETVIYASPYKNIYDRRVAQAVKGYSYQHINQDRAINHCATNYEIPSQLENTVMRHPGSEPTMEATLGERVPTIAKQTIEVSERVS